MATSEQNTLIKKAQPYKINTRSAIRDNMSDINISKMPLNIFMHNWDHPEAIKV